MPDKKAEDVKMEKIRKEGEEMARIANKYKVEVIPDEYTPKVNSKIKIVSDFVADNKDMLSSIAIYLSQPQRSMRAVGLAANQISINGKRLMKNFFMMRQKMSGNSGFDIIFNPEILEKRGTRLKKYESCLTWENDNVEAYRWPFIIVKFQDMNGTVNDGVAITGFEAQVWQHEIDHLNGVEEILVPKTEKVKDEVIIIGRNNVCMCGSGKKYKKCCLFYDNC